MKTQYPRARKIIVYVVVGALGVEYLESPEFLDEALHRRTVQQLPAQSPLARANSYGHPESPGVPTSPREMRIIATTTGTSAAATDMNDFATFIASTKYRAGR